MQKAYHLIGTYQPYLQYILADIRTAYHKATEEIQADSIIPSGDVIFIKGEIDEYTGNRKIFSCPIFL